MRRKDLRFAAMTVAVAIAAIGLAACTSPARTPASLQVPATWQGVTASGQSIQVQRDWWKALGDPALDRLVELALKNNSDLRLAAARVAEARAAADVQHSFAWPTLGVGWGVDRARDIFQPTGTPYVATNREPQFQAAYEVDVWGRVADLASAGDAQLLASQASRDSAALGVAATTATSYISLRALDARLLVARQTLASREVALQLAQSRQASGYASAFETKQSEAEYRATAQAIPQLELAIARQEHALRILIGANPGPIERGDSLLELTISVIPTTGLPSDLLRGRPDIAAAEDQLVASDAQWAASRTQLLPAVKLSGEIGSATSSVLLHNPYSLWTIGASVLAPIFDGGRLRAQVAVADARRDQALVIYQKTVLTAFGEVEDQLAAVEDLGQQYVQVKAQRRALEEAQRIASNRYREGYASHLDELDVERGLYSAQQAELQLRADQLNAQVALFRALGGGWQRSATP